MKENNLSIAKDTGLDIGLGIPALFMQIAVFRQDGFLITNEAWKGQLFWTSLVSRTFDSLGITQGRVLLFDLIYGSSIRSAQCSLPCH